MKVFDASVVTCRPTIAFVAPNASVAVSFQHVKFDYKAEEQQSVYSKRKVRIILRKILAG